MFSMYMEITKENKAQIRDDFVKKMTKAVEDELDAVGRRYKGLGPNRRQEFKNALAEALAALTKPPVDTRVPDEVVGQLASLGFTEEQADTILSLISLPENSTLDWWKNYNFAKRLGDNRGWTTTLYGACSGTGDLLMVLKELQKINPNHKLVKYIKPMEKTIGDDVTGLENLGKDIENLGDDKEWQRAVWKIYIKLYWNFAKDFADKTGTAKDRPGPKMTSPLTRGYMVDVALNHGSNMESFGPIIKKMRNKNETDESKWFLDFVEARRQLLKVGFQDLDTSKTGDRATLWANLFKTGNVELKRPMKLFRGYWTSTEPVLS
ncbi:chitosanase [Paramecium bursaria Chlorella virus NE-JV-1]|nr:chitosanase [Paramecium bursaria Chlorella virus NE-JV-1]